MDKELDKVVEDKVADAVLAETPATTEVVSEGTENGETVDKTDKVDVKDDEAETVAESVETPAVAERIVPKLAETVSEAAIEDAAEGAEAEAAVVSEANQESIEAIFTGAETLSEDFKKRAATVFDVALKTRLSEEIEKIEEAAQETMKVRLKEHADASAAKVDEYLGYVVKEWMEENKLSVEQGIRAEIAESFLEDMKAVFESHNISIPAEKVDMLESANKENADLKDQVTKLTESAIEKDAKLFAFEKAATVANLSEGLVATQVEKLKSLLENVEANDIETFTEKAKIVKESFFEDETIKADDNTTPSRTLNESVESKPSTVKSPVDAYAAFAKRVNNN